jgi:hypothetical protein
MMLALALILSPTGLSYTVTPEIYQHYFGEMAGFQVEHMAPVPAELSHPSRAGKEWLGTWRKK